MFNLLPRAEKESVRREYRLRLSAVTLWFIAATFAAGIIMLLPSWFLSSQKERAAEARFEALKKDGAERETTGLQDTLREASEELKLLSHEPPKIYLQELLAQTISKRTPKISVDSVTVRAAAENKRTLQITGSAADRAALVAFSRSLEEIRVFEKVDLPVSNLAKDRDIPFSITAAGSF